MSYCVHFDEDNAVVVLKNFDRVCRIELRVWRPQWEKVVAAMQVPFPMLTHLKLHGFGQGNLALTALTNGFLGGSAPRLQNLELYGISFPELPTFLLSARDLVYLRLENIPPTGCVSPEAMVTGLAVLTRLETFWMVFSELRPQTEQRRRRPDPPMRAVLPALTSFRFRGCSKYLDDLVAEIDAPRLTDVDARMLHFDFLPVPQLFLLIDRTENLRFRRVSLRLDYRDELEIKLRVDQNRLGSTFLPHFYLSAGFDWSGTHVVHIAFVLTQTFTMCSNVDFLYIIANDGRPGWRNNIDSAEWLAFFRLIPTVKTLHICSTFVWQVALALEDLPEEMVAEMLPSLQILILETEDEDIISVERFVSLRRHYGCPITVRDCALDETEEL